MTNNHPEERRLHTDEELQEYLMKLFDDVEDSPSGLWHLCIYEGLLAIRPIEHSSQPHMVFKMLYRYHMIRGFSQKELAELTNQLHCLKEKILCRKNQKKR